MGHPKAKIQLHWIGEFKDQITYRNGAEVVGDPETKQAKSAQTMMHPGWLIIVAIQSLKNKWSFTSVTIRRITERYSSVLTQVLFVV
jgi:hypothetical protein